MLYAFNNFPDPSVELYVRGEIKKRDDVIGFALDYCYTETLNV